MSKDKNLYFFPIPLSTNVDIFNKDSEMFAIFILKMEKKKRMQHKYFFITIQKCISLCDLSKLIVFKFLKSNTKQINPRTETS